MTREEKTNWLNELLEYEENNDIGNLTRAERREFQQWISEALEQEPQTFEWCHDCSEYDQDKHCCPRFNRVIRNAVEEIKQPKTGHWIEGQTDNSNIHNILCSCCCEGYPSKGHANSQYTREKFKYCPNCGARMIALQESEDKE